MVTLLLRHGMLVAVFFPDRNSNANVFCLQAAYNFCVHEATRQVELMQEAVLSIMVHGQAAKV